MEADKCVYDVKIAGLPLKLRASHDEETVHRLISFVDEKVEQAMAQSQNMSFQNALLLAALHIAEELLSLKSVASAELDSLEGRAQQILSELESSPISRIGLES